MDVKQLYYNFLAEHGAKEKVQSIIRKGIEEWKRQQAYYYSPDDNDPGDYSGHCHMIGDKKIGDIAKNDTEVLKAYTGDSEATYTSGFGLRWLRVADRISDDINICLLEFKGEFILENCSALFEEYNIEHCESLTEYDIFLTLDEVMIDEFCGSLHYRWMKLEFPEYEVDDEDMPSLDYLFGVKD